jgi:hypothetical protein
MKYEAFFRLAMPEEDADKIRNYCRQRGRKIYHWCHETLMNEIKKQEMRGNKKKRR